MPTFGASRQLRTAIRAPNLLTACGNQTPRPSVFRLEFRGVKRGNDSPFAGAGRVDEAALAKVNAVVRDAGFIGVREEHQVARFEKRLRDWLAVVELFGGRVRQRFVA